MSTIYTNVSETPVHVVDPITHQAVSSLIKRLGATNMFTFNDNINIHHERSANSLTSDPDGQLRLDTDNRLDVEAETSYNPGVDQWFNPSSDYNTPASLMSSIYKNTYKQIFLDAPIGFSCQEITVPCTTTLRLRFTSPYYDKALFLLEQITNVTQNELINDARDLSYAYPINWTALTILYLCWKYRDTWKAEHPGANSLFEYVCDIVQNKIGIGRRRLDLNQDAEKGSDTNEWQFLIKHHQLSAVAALRCDHTRPQEEKDGNLSTHYTVEAEYKIFFSRPKLLQFTLPPIVEQHQLPNTIFKDVTNNADYNLLGSYTDTSYNDVAYLLNGNQNYRSGLARMPSYDDWFVPTVSPIRKWKFAPFVIAVSTLDPVSTDPQTKISTYGGPTKICLKDLDHAPITPFAYEILSKHDKFDITDFHGLFNITVYSNNLPLNPKFIEWDPTTFTLTFTADRKENVYRIVVSEATCVDFLDPKWTKTIIDYRYYFPMLIMRSFQYLSRQGLIKFGGGDKLTGLISRLRSSGKLTAVLEKMIENGVPEIIKYLDKTDGQLADVLCNTPFKSTYADDQGEKTGSLFDLFVRALLDLQLVKRSEIPFLEINTGNNLYPYQITGIGTDYYSDKTTNYGRNVNGFNGPTRVGYSRIRPVR